MRWWCTRPICGCRSTNRAVCAGSRSGPRWRCGRYSSPGLDYLQARAQIAQPVLAYCGENDEFLFSKEGCEGSLEPIPDHTIEMVAGGDHMSLVTRERSRPLWRETPAWLVDTLERS